MDAADAENNNLLNMACWRGMISNQEFQVKVESDNNDGVTILFNSAGIFNV